MPFLVIFIYRQKVKLMTLEQNNSPFHSSVFKIAGFVACKFSLNF